MSPPPGLDLGRLAKLLDLLASDRDGEVIAAARAADRAVRAAGLDWARVLGLPAPGSGPAAPALPSPPDPPAADPAASRPQGSDLQAGAPDPEEALLIADMRRIVELSAQRRLPAGMRWKLERLLVDIARGLYGPEDRRYIARLHQRVIIEGRDS